MVRRDSMKILVVEDNPKNRKLFRVIIESIGHQCLLADDGQDGVALARQEVPDLIFMDIQMPRMNGVAALRCLRQNNATQSIPVLALTSYAMKGDRERFLLEGFNDYMEKPISMDRFIEMIREYE